MASLQDLPMSGFLMSVDMQAVLHFVQQAGIHQTDGVSYADICRDLKRRPTSLCYCLKDLVEDGALYTTIDDEHFQFLGTWEICRTCSVDVNKSAAIEKSRNKINNKFRPLYRAKKS